MTSNQTSKPIRVIYTAQDVDQQQRHTKFLRRREAKQRSPLKTLGAILLVVLYVIPVMAFVTTSRDVPIAITLYVAFAPWIAGVLISRWSHWRAKRAFIDSSDWVEFQSTDRGLSYRAAWYESQIAWSAITTITHYRQQYVVTLRNRNRLFVPTHSFDDAADAVTWLRDAQSRIAEAATTVTEVGTHVPRLQ